MLRRNNTKTVGHRKRDNLTDFSTTLQTSKLNMRAHLKPLQPCAPGSRPPSRRSPRGPPEGGIPVGLPAGLPAGGLPAVIRKQWYVFRDTKDVNHSPFLDNGHYMLSNGHYLLSNGHYWKIIHHRKSGRHGPSRLPCLPDFRWWVLPSTEESREINPSGFGC